MTAAPAARPFVIRDPVHGYVAAAAHERVVLDHPITQRLRRITETGLTEYVFPEARTSRFVHSLGAMHLASRFVRAALENADDAVAYKFFEEIDKRYGEVMLPRAKLERLLLQDGALSALSAVRASFAQPRLRPEPVKYRRLLALVEAALRLAALFHDLGHLPFSHDGEYALQDFASKKSADRQPLAGPLASIAGAEAPHEQLGHLLADLVLRSIVDKTEETETHVAFQFALDILNAEPPDYGGLEKPQTSALQWLHSLVDGEIDADRGDYLLRDGQALGLEFATYDLDRLVNNLVVIFDPSLGYMTAIREQGLPALESYCLSRSRSHQVFVRHHKVAQVAAALRFASVMLLESAAATPFLNVLASVGDEEKWGTEGADILHEFSRFDESWWTHQLRDLQDSTTDELGRACLDLALDRKVTLKSVWKRKGDLPDHIPAGAINERVDRFFAGRAGKVDLVDARRRLLKEGVLISPFKFKPYARRYPGDGSSGSVMLVKTKKPAPVPASTASALIRSLQTVWDEDIHLYAFTRVKAPVSAERILELLGPSASPSGK